MNWAAEFEAAQHRRSANVVCMKWGTLYGPEWVNKLYGMVVRNTTWNVRFVCLTDDNRGIRKEVECLPLPALALDRRTHVNGRKDDPWWNKVSLYRKDLHDLSGMTLYLDLDVVIVSSIDDLFTYPGRFCMMLIWRADRYGGKLGNSSVTRLFVGAESNIYERFVSQPSMHWEAMYHGHEQSFVCASAEDLTFFPPQWCVSFKSCLPRNAVVRFFSEPVLPPDAKIIVFFGANTPYAALKGEINPGKKWGAWRRFSPYRKRFRPAPWVAEHWSE